MTGRLPFVLLLAAGLSLSAAIGPAADEVLLKLRIEDQAGQPIPCRVHLYDPQGKPVAAPGLPFWRDHFAVAGQAFLSLPPGEYRYEIERGPEHARLDGRVALAAGKPADVRLTLPRIANLAARGWYSGDLHIHRPVEEIELLMQSEDLNIGPVITWWNSRNAWAGRSPPRDRPRGFDGGRRFHDVLAGEDERGGGALLFFHLDAPLPIAKAAREHPSPLTFAAAARRQNPNVWIDVEKPFWWDAPTWLAVGRPDSIGIANNHMCRRQMLANEAWGKPRDEKGFPGPTGNGRWTQEIYYHALNCGLRVPPSAGSASGVLPNPVGYNRVYVRLDRPLDYSAWWAGLKAGRSFVTNGPLLICRADGRLPGHVFRAESGNPLDLSLDVELTTLDVVPRLEIVKNGRVDAAIELKRQLTQTIAARVRFTESGWFLVRAVADNAETYRFAATAPFFVEVGGRPRISQASARFFLEWIQERIDRLEKATLADQERQEVLAPHREAAQFYRRLMQEATAE